MNSAQAADFAAKVLEHFQGATAAGGSLAVLQGATPTDASVKGSPTVIPEPNKVISSQISMQFTDLPANVLGSELQQDTKFTQTLIQSIATGLGVDAVSVQITDIVVDAATGDITIQYFVTVGGTLALSIVDMTT